MPNIELDMDSCLEHCTEEDKVILEKIIKRSEYNELTRCYIWKGSITKKSYPYVYHINRSTMLVRPFVYRCYVNPEHKSKLLTTACGNNLCVAPSHITTRISMK